MYQNYIFDLYGTLVDLRTDEYKDELWRKTAILYGYHGARYTAPELRAAYGELVEKEKASVRSRHPEFSAIDIKLEKVFRLLYARKGVRPSNGLVRFTAEAFRCFSTEFIRLYDGVTDLLDTLRSKGKRIYLLSNAQRVFTEKELDMLGLTPYFDGILISSDIECSKPDAHFFAALFDRYGLVKNESVMIGNDHICDIGGAADFGIDSLYIRQEISPVPGGEIRSAYAVPDGDVYKIKALIVK